MFLPMGWFTPVLPPDAAVHHGKERRRHLDKRDAAHERGCGKSGKVADDAAAERHDRGLAVEGIGQKRRVNGVGPIQVLVLLAVGNDRWT